MADTETTPQETTTPATTETPKQEAVQPEPLVSKAQTVADGLEDQAFGKPSTEEPAETTETTEEKPAGEDVKPETSEPEEKPSTPEKTDGLSDNIQKRIDTLTARRKEAEEKATESENRAIRLEERIRLAEEGRLTKPTDGKEKEKLPEYSDEQIRRAMKTFMDEGDTDGILDIMDHKVKKMETNLRSEYEAEQKKVTEVQAKSNEEWKSVVKDFSPGSYNDPMFDDDPDFDITSKESLIFQVAEAFSKDTDVMKNYQGSGWMKRIVNDAFVEILKQKMSGSSKDKTEEPKDKGLKSRLAKEQRKNSLAEGTPSLGESEEKPQSNQSLLDEALSERKSYKDKRTGVGV